MKAPSAADLLKAPEVAHGLEIAWVDSLCDDPVRRHEEGGWIYVDPTSGNLTIRRAVAGKLAAIDLNDPPIAAGAFVVATFHTHPNPMSEGWNPGPSPGDTQSAWLLGVPCLIRAEDGIHTTGPKRRRGGLAGNAGFPS